MPLVQKLNVVLEVSDAQLERYIDKGYDVIDDNGQVIKEAIPNDLNKLQITVVKQKQEIAALKEKIAKLEAEAKVEAPKVYSEEAPMEDKPVAKRGRKKAA